MGKRVKQMMACLMAGVLISMAGCGNTEQSIDSFEKGGNTESISSDGDNSQKEKAMGRYVESDIPLPESIFAASSVEKLEDGDIALFDPNTGLHLSTDGGENFVLQETGIMEALGESYPWLSTISKDGSLFINYMDNVESEEEGGDQEDVQGEVNTEDEDTDDSEDTDGDEVIENQVVLGDTDDEDDSFGYSFDQKYIYMDKDKNIKDFTISDGGNNLFSAFYGLSDGKILGASGKDVYMIDAENESCEKLCSGKDYIEYIKEIRGKVYIIGQSTLEIYNLETGSFEEDKVLEDFVGEISTVSYGQGNSSVAMCEGADEGSLYIASSQGVYRHVVQGTVLEEVIKGSLSSMGSPTYSFNNMFEKEDNEFLICYNSSELKSYVYDASVGSVPENELTIYSLEENASVRQAINLYQNNNPDVFFQYEVGLSGDGSITKEDAIRNLNTKLLSGEGPDILLLDDMPIESYIQKGVLADLTSGISANYKEGELQEIVKNTYQREENIYALPAFFTIPVLISEQKESLDLKGIADKVEALRGEYSDGSIIGAYIEERVLEFFYDVSAAGWQQEDGSIDRDKLTEFLTETKRIYQAEKEGITEEEVGRQQMYFQEAQEGGYRGNTVPSLYYISGDVKLLLGEMTGITDYNTITSVLKKKNESSFVTGMNGLAENVYIPNTILGVNEGSSSKEIAVEFVLSMISPDMQGVDLARGFPIHKQSRDELLKNPYADAEDGESAAMIMSVSDDSGFMETLEIIWSNEEEIAQLNQVMDNLKTPAYVDSTLKDVILEYGKAALNEEQSVDDAVNEIINKMQIYLSE